MVFDIVNNQVGMAQTAFNETGSDIVPFPSNGAAIPSATAAPNQGETDTPASGDKPDFSAADGFQNNGGGSRGPAGAGGASGYVICALGRYLIFNLFAIWGC